MHSQPSLSAHSLAISIIDTHVTIFLGLLSSAELKCSLAIVESAKNYACVKYASYWQSLSCLYCLCLKSLQSPAFLQPNRFYTPWGGSWTGPDQEGENISKPVQLRDVHACLPCRVGMRGMWHHADIAGKRCLRSPIGELQKFAELQPSPSLARLDCWEI